MFGLLASMSVRQWGTGQVGGGGGNPSAQHGRKPDTSCEPNLMCTVIFMCNFIRHTHSLPVCVLVCVFLDLMHTELTKPSFYYQCRDILGLKLRSGLSLSLGFSRDG